jgi:phage terminase large subunit
MQVVLPHNWKPRPYQEPLWRYLSRGGKRAVAKWHRRAGKDDVFLHHTACAAHERIGNYWYLLPEYSQARKSMWDSVNPHTGKRRIDEAFPKEIRKRYSEQEMMIGFHNGSTFQLVGSDNFNSLVGSPPIGLVFSEYALSNPAAWAYLMPILEENGGWAGFNGTPRGNNHYKNLCRLALDEMRDGKDWFYDEKNADQTGVFTPEQLQSILKQLQATHGDDFGKSLFLQEYYGSFDAAIPGAIWGDCMDKASLAGRITSVPVDPVAPVFTAWDLGRTDSTAIWFYQFVGNEIHVVDYHESSLKDIPYYADLLRTFKKAHGIRYGTHWLPHDARARTLAAGGKSIQQQMIDQDVGRIAIAKRLDHVDGIQAARATFPFVWIDADRCEQGIEVLRNYHYEWDEEKRVFSSMPAHDWASHGASAWRTLALSWKAPKEGSPDNAAAQAMAARVHAAGGQTFGDFKKQHLNRMREARQYH